eukprot:g14935.t1
MGRLPELNHWVSLSSENAATAHESAVAASTQFKQTAWQTRDDAQAAVELAQAEQVPGQEKTLVEVKTAFKKASDMCNKREEYHALLTGTYFDEESDDRRRKAKAAAASRPEATEEGGGLGVGGKTSSGEPSGGAAKGAGAALGGGEGGAMAGDPGAGDKKDGSEEDGGVDPNPEIRTLRRRAKRYQEMAAKFESQGEMDITSGTRFHTGGWSTDGGWGTVMRRNLDEECEIVSYDIFMDDGTRVETVPASAVEADVNHGKKLKAQGPSQGKEDDDSDSKKDVDGLQTGGGGRKMKKEDRDPDTEVESGGRQSGGGGADINNEDGGSEGDNSPGPQSKDGARKSQQTADKQRYSYCEIVCKHAGAPRKRAEPAPGKKSRVCKNQEIGCPFKLVMTWRVEAPSPSITPSYCGHNHDPSGAVSTAAKDAVPLQAINERIDDIGRWTRAGVNPGEIFKLLEMDQEGRVLCRDGKKKVYNAMAAIKDQLYSSPEDAANFLATLQSEPGTTSLRYFAFSAACIGDSRLGTTSTVVPCTTVGGSHQMATTSRGAFLMSCKRLDSERTGTAGTRDGRDEGLDDNYEGPTFDDDCGGERVHPAEREGRATDRKACDRRRVFATMMAKSKENVGEIMKAVSSDQALHIQAQVDNYVRYLLADADGDTKAKNPAPVKPPGRPKGQGASSQTTVSNPRALKDNTKRTTRFKGSEEGGRKSKKIKQNPE